MRMNIKALLVAGIIMLGGCSTVPHQPKTFDQLGQYQTIPLNASSYRISFKANSNLSYGSAEEIALVKSAQVTVQQGFDFFKVIDDPSNRTSPQTQRQTVVYPNRYPSYGPYGRFNRPYYDPFFDQPYVVDIDPIEVSYTVQMFKKDVAPHDAFEAMRILQTLGSKYGVRPDGTIIVPTSTPLPKQ